jgi:hypothetical protein
MVTYSDDSSFSNTGNNIDVGGTLTGIYTLAPPDSSVNYCTIQTNIAVNTDGSTPSSKINNCGS